MSDWQEAYPAVGRALAPEYRALPREDVEALLEASFGEGFGLDEAEGFFDDIGRTLGKVARVAAPVVQRILPGVASGAAGGAALGPFGALGGALLGGLTGALGSQGPARAAAPGPASVPAAARPGGAVGQLLAALGSPTVQQALSSMMLGRAGGRTVATPGGAQLPVAAVTSLLGMLANRASAEWEEAFAADELAAASAWEGFDLAAPEVRAELVLGQLAPLEAADEESGEESLSGEAADPAEGVEEAWIDELYDELEAQAIAGDEAAYEAETESWSVGANG